MCQHNVRSDKTVLPRPSHFRLKSLDNISGFGLFRSFVWNSDQLPDFGRYNLIFGLNYSGKTTLSRVFQCVEDSKLPSDLQGGTFQFTMGDGTQVTQDRDAPVIAVRVFNRHFIRKNFRIGSDMTGASAILVVGEENERLKSRGKALEGHSSRVRRFESHLRQQKEIVQRAIDDAGTDQARIVNAIVDGPFDRRHFIQAVDSLPGDCWPLPLKGSVLVDKKEQYRRAADFSAVPLFKPNHSAIVRRARRIQQGLLEVATNTAVEALQRHYDLESWVQKGLALNEVATPCGFCGSVISQPRWAELQGHFSKAFSELQAQIEDHLSAVRELDFGAPAIADSSLFPDLRVRFGKALVNLKSSLANAEDSAAAVGEILKAKLKALETPIEWKPVFEPAAALRLAVGTFNVVLEEHNSRVATADAVKAEARRSICEHYAVEYLRDSAILDKRQKMGVLDQRIADCRAVKKRIESDLAANNLAIKAASIGARRMNENLALLLPGDDIEVVKLNDTDFEFQRGGNVANNMSEGERTAVAFSYFLTNLEEGEAPLEETIVVLDDPISSLDANHIYSVYSLIENRLASARQLIVLTHNSSFFGITKDWMRGKTESYYMVQREQDAAGEWSASLVSLPAMLKKFKSDYQYNFYCLMKLDEDPAPRFEHLAGVPNMIRRLLEAYLGFVIPEKSPWGDKLVRIVPSKEACGKIKKFVDENSHSHSLTQATEIPDYVAHCKVIVREVLGAIEAHNPEHVASLKAEFLAEEGNLP